MTAKPVGDCPPVRKFSAERALFSGECEMVVAPGAMGELGILPRHSPLVTRLKPGEVRATMPGGEERSFYVSGGMLEVQPHVVTVLSDTGQRAEDLDEAAALAAQEQAERMLADRAADVDEARARAELVQVAAQLRAIRRMSGRR